MKPPPFRYVRAANLAHALETLVENAGAAKVLAGGQSLMPMLNFRMLEPAVIVDINGLDDLQGIHERAEGVRVGALTRHRETEGSDVIARHFPVLTQAMRQVAHLTIRNRGTFGGSLCHADPSAELPLMAMLLDARIEIAGPKGQRVLSARAFLVSALTTALADDEIVTAIELPLLPRHCGWAFEEVARRQGDYALAAVAVTLAGKADRLEDVRIALAGVGQTALRMDAAEAGLRGHPLTDHAIAEAARWAAAGCAPMTDLHASADYRRHLIAVLTRRCLTQARDRWHAARRGSQA